MNPHDSTFNKGGTAHQSIFSERKKQEKRKKKISERHTLFLHFLIKNTTSVRLKCFQIWTGRFLS
jgi:hypothetical protein